MLRCLPLLAAAILLLTACATPTPRIEMTTDLGIIVVEVYPEAAPITVANFLQYVDEDRWSGASFYRTVRLDNQPDNDVLIEVIQGGLGFREDEQRLPPIAHETTTTTGILHRDGTLSMARSDPGSASSEFFICIGDQPALDYGGARNPDGQGFAAFGQVIDGIDVVRAIQQQAAEEQMLTEPVQIRSIQRLQ